MADTNKEAKVVKKFKGDVVKVKDLPVEGPLAVERTTANPVVKDSWSKVNLPKFFTVQGATKDAYSQKRYISYVSHKDGNRGAVYLPNDLELKVLTGLQGKAVLDKFNAYAIKHIADMPIYLSTIVGADPEFFVEDKKGKIIPAFEFLKASADPAVALSKVEGQNNYGGQKVYWDGFQAEFTVGANNCLGWVSDSIQASMRCLYKEAHKYNKNARLSTKTLIEVPLDVLANTKPEYVEFGCKPSLNVYNLKSGLDVPAREIPFRSSGGHIHFGFGKQNPETVTRIVKALDAILAVGCVSLFARYDHPMRRRFYGLPGEYRLPAHGLEYRTLSNAWLFHPFLTNMVIDLARKVTNFGYNNYLHFWQAEEKETIATIMTCDVEQARKILDRNKEIMLALFKASYRGGNAAEVCFKAMRNGLETAIKDPTDIVGNWMLGDKVSKWIAHCAAPNLSVANSYVTLSAGKLI
jgi:hypothetical protein